MARGGFGHGSQGLGTGAAAERYRTASHEFGTTRRTPGAGLRSAPDPRHRAQQLACGGAQHGRKRR
jgi:hypothetical protein